MLRSCQSQSREPGWTSGSASAGGASDGCARSGPGAAKRVERSDIAELARDSDDLVGTEFGDVGRIYFWITRQTIADRLRARLADPAVLLTGDVRVGAQPTRIRGRP